MIKAIIIYSKDGKVCGFEVENHGEPIVCAAVSMLTLNTANSIESFTKDDFDCDYEVDGGFISFIFKNSKKISSGAKILLDSLVLGLESIQEHYPENISVTHKKVC